MVHKHFALLFLVLTLSLIVTAQSVSVGAKIGIPSVGLIDATSSTTLQSLAAKGYQVGVSTEVHLPARFGVELDVLHSNADYRRTLSDSSGPSGVWEFPLVAKYTFLSGAFHPYLEGGMAFRALTSLPTTVGEISKKGWVVGGGLEFRIGIFRLSPELRFNNWNGPRVSSLNANLRGASVLLGLTF